MARSGGSLRRSDMSGVGGEPDSRRADSRVSVHDPSATCRRPAPRFAQHGRSGLAVAPLSPAPARSCPPADSYHRASACPTTWPSPARQVVERAVTASRQGRPSFGAGVLSEVTKVSYDVNSTSLRNEPTVPRVPREVARWTWTASCTRRTLRTYASFWLKRQITCSDCRF